MNRKVLFLIAVVGFIPTFLSPGCIDDPVTKNDTAFYPEGVVMLDSANFSTMLAKPGLIAFVDFFSPTCDSCKKFDDTITVIAQRYKNKALIGKVNNMQNDTLRNAFIDCIGQYPNLLFFNGGKLAKCKHGVMRVEAVAKILDSLIASAGR